VSVGFVLLANGTAFDIFSNIGSESRPPKLGSDQLAGFKVSWVSGGFVIMTSFKDGMADGVVIRDIDSAFVSKDSSFMLPVGEAGMEGEGNGSVHRLEGLEYEGIIGRGGLNAVREGGVDDADKKGRRE